jgi:malate dehydrogenase (oxaloacetate-decarboxylating)
MKKPHDVEALLAKAQQPSAEALRLHPLYRGKLEVTPKCAIRGLDDFALWYTPGVAAPCRDIVQHPERVFAYTNKGNFVAIVSDGTRVLGLGAIGPQAALPVMEGKAMLFKYLGGVDAFPLCLATTQPDELVQAVHWLAPTFGGINLEDIATPKCFTVLERLRAELALPVWHDDQQGTAAVTLAGLLNALQVVGKAKDEVTIALIGAGAAGIAIARLLRAAGFPPGHMRLVDTTGILHPGRDDLRTPAQRAKWQMCECTNQDGRRGGIPEALRGADVCLAFARSGPGVIQPQWVAAMARDAIVFACGNPVPEIWPWEAEDAGARIVATGRSDFPNQVNNALIFPGLFRGVLDIQARTITDAMGIAAAAELARCAEERGLSATSILPRLDEWEVVPRLAAAVGCTAIAQGVASVTATKEELRAKAATTITRAREETRVLMDHGLIALPA